jgi:hypothetical protein
LKIEVEMKLEILRLGQTFLHNIFFHDVKMQNIPSFTYIAHYDFKQTIKAQMKLEVLRLGHTFLHNMFFFHDVKMQNVLSFTYIVHYYQ